MESSFLQIFEFLLAIQVSAQMPNLRRHSPSHPLYSSHPLPCYGFHSTYFHLKLTCSSVHLFVVYLLTGVAATVLPQGRRGARAGAVVLHVGLQAGEGGRALVAADLLARGLGGGAGRGGALREALTEGGPQAVQGPVVFTCGLLHATGLVGEVGAVEFSPLLVLRDTAPIVLPRDDGRVTAFHGKACVELSLHPVRIGPEERRQGGEEGERGKRERKERG